MGCAHRTVVSLQACEIPLVFCLSLPPLPCLQVTLLGWCQSANYSLLRTHNDVIKTRSSQLRRELWAAESVLPSQPLPMPSMQRCFLLSCLSLASTAPSVSPLQLAY